MKKNILFFIVGLLCGAIALNLLWMNAIKVHTNIIRSALEVEQQFLAQRAEREGDYMRGVVHRWNAVDAVFQDGFRVFRSEICKEVDGGFFFPFHAIVLQQIEKAAGPLEKGRRTNEALHRAQLALTIEKAGMPKMATEQWKKAAELIPVEINKLKKMTLKLREDIHSDLAKEAEKVILNNMK